MQMKLKSHQEKFIRAAYASIGEVVSRQDVLDLCEAEGFDYPHWLISNQKYRHHIRGHYVLPLERVPDLKARHAARLAGGDLATWVPGTKSAKTAKTAKATPPAPAPAPSPEPKVAVGAATSSDSFDPSLAFNGGRSLVPDRLDIYVPWGNHDYISKVVASRAFYPVYISGLSGNGKTTTVEQACAEQGREFFRVNINEETDEDDLLGGFRLVNGNTVFQYGPVVEAMRRGAVLLLDEIDLGKGKILCLQSVLEGKGVYLKKINQWIHPADGFQVFLTGNTKGQGSGEHDDRFVGTNVMNEAFLDRIPVMIDQGYPPLATEKKILSKVVTKHCGVIEDDSKMFIDNLTKWAEIVRRTFDEGAIDDIITTRRLVQIIQGYCIMGTKDRIDSIRNCITRFEKTVQDSFLSLYEKIDGETGKAPEVAASGSPVVDGYATAPCPLPNHSLAIALPGVNFAQRGIVKSLGATWNPVSKQWFFDQSRWENLVDRDRETLRQFDPTWVSWQTSNNDMIAIGKVLYGSPSTPVAVA